MRKYQEKQEAKLMEVVCNKCGKNLRVENGILKEGCFFATPKFGYFSKKDGTNHKFDLCEACYDEMISKFRIPVEILGETEILGV